MACYLCNDLHFIAPHGRATAIFGRGLPLFIPHEARPEDHHHPVIACPACGLRDLTSGLQGFVHAYRLDHGTGFVEAVKRMLDAVPPPPDNPLVTIIPKAADDIDLAREVPEDWNIDYFDLGDKHATEKGVEVIVEKYLLALLRSERLDQVNFAAPGAQVGGCGPKGDCRECDFELWENTQVNSAPRIGYRCTHWCHDVPKNFIESLRELIKNNQY